MLSSCVDLAAQNEPLYSNQPVVQLYQFGVPKELTTYTLSISPARITKCRFDTFGEKFGASDNKGDLHLWKFDSGVTPFLPPLQSLSCHSISTNDFIFLNSGSFLATAGSSSNHK